MPVGDTSFCRRILLSAALLCSTVVPVIAIFNRVASAVDAAPRLNVPGPAAAAHDRGADLPDDEGLPPKLEPVRPRTGAEEARLDAMAWFGTGRMLQQRGDLPGALRAYRKALERDPTASAVYRAAIPLAVQLNQFDEAAKWAARAVELMPDDYDMLLKAAALLLQQQDLPGAIHVLEQAVQAPGLDRQSAQYVKLMRDLALMYAAANRPNEAVVAFEVVFDALVNPEKYKLDPREREKLQNDKQTGFERLGQIFLEQKKTDLALQAFQKAAESKRGPAVANLSFHLAQVYLQAEQPAKALEEIQKYIDSQRVSKERAAYELLAEILKSLGKSDELIPRLEAAAAADTRNSFLSYFLADQYAEAGRLPEAEALYKKTLDGSSELAGYVGLAGVYRRQGKPADLLDALAKGYHEAGELKGMTTEFKAIIADEKLLGSLLEIGEKRLSEGHAALNFDTGYVLANLASDSKRTALAEKFYRYLLGLRKERAILIYEELGSHYFEVRKFAEAAKIYQEAVDDPTTSEMRPNLLVMLTRAKGLAGDAKGALEAIKQAQDLLQQPNNPLLRSEEAWVYAHSHQFDEAIKLYEQLLADFPQPQFRSIIRNVQFGLSNVYVLKGDMTRGEEILEEVYKESPNDIRVNNDLGYLYADQGKNLEQAEAMIRKALAAEPENAAYLDSMGWVLFKRGKSDEALPYLEKAIKISTGGGDEALWDHLGDVHDARRETADAVAAWQKALELARQASFPDRKLIDRVEEKLRNQKHDGGKLIPSRPGAP